MAQRITFDNKVDLVTTSADRINKSTAADWNDVKSVVNSHADALESGAAWSGWGAYADTQYPNSGTAFTLTADTDTIFPNNAGTKRETQLPTDLTSFVDVIDLGTYEHSRIRGNEGDSIDTLVYFKAVPSANDQWVDVWLDLGGEVGQIYRQTFTFPKGAGIERSVVYTLASLYQSATWEANGGTLYVRSNNTLQIYDIDMNVDRTHKAR